MRYAHIVLALAAVGLLTAAPLEAQARLGSVPPEHNRPGWTFIPTFGFAESYDDNITFFGRGTADAQNNDYLATFSPAGNLDYVGRHTKLNTAYRGSFLDYRTFSALNRWDQHGHVEIRHEQTAQLKWFGRANVSLLPSTDAIELGGIPFRHAGARTADGRGGFQYQLGARDFVNSALQVQSVSFDRRDATVPVLRGGHVIESLTTYRRKLDERLAVGLDYSFRLASVFGDTEHFDIHTTQAGFEYQLSPIWSLSGGAGIVYLQQTATTAAHLGPAWRASIERHHSTGTTFHVGYLRSYIPSFGFGGTIQNQEVGAGLKMQLFGSRDFYTDNSAVFRDDTPLTDFRNQLPLRSLRTHSILGWEPQGWVRVEAFYARVQQTSLRAGGQLFRNQIGFQIVTSKPVRMQ